MASLLKHKLNDPAGADVHLRVYRETRRRGKAGSPRQLIDPETREVQPYARLKR